MKWQPSPARRSGEHRRPSSVGSRTEHRPQNILIYFEVRKCVWQQPFWFFSCEAKCPSEVSEPKWASALTTLCDGTYWYSDVTCTYCKGLRARREFGGSCNLQPNPRLQQGKRSNPTTQAGVMQQRHNPRHNNPWWWR